ncbi:MAG: hypothetical protein COZ47_04825 [Lysobacterales bacterium CG_4_10_14_3_um_filter_64_11]|nr:MAG: hypothetical protein COZ47_04825 [Xanthomonadales bacterium CG_4_10_14_3_um_filter_64_11]
MPLILIKLRYLGIIGALLALLLANANMDLGPARMPLLSALAVLLAGNVVAHVWLRRRQADGEVLVLVQMAIDVIALTVVLNYSGGPGNPFASLYLVPVSVAAATMPRRYAIAVALLATGLYTGLLYGHQHRMHLGGSGFANHVTGMWVQFLVSAMILLVVLCRFRAIVEDQRQRLAQARERQLRDESLIAVGALAAGTAHELNTPLSTLGMLVDECADSPLPPAADDYRLMREQLSRCRKHVAVLAALARRGALGETVVQSVDGFLDDCLDQWQLLRPGVAVERQQQLPGVRIAVDQGLPQALINLLNNAADANAAAGNAHMVTLDGSVRDDRYVLHILDRGPGLRTDSGAVNGHTRGTGLGIGLLISNASIERCGGRVRLFARDGGGCVTEVVLPMEKTP